MLCKSQKRDVCNCSQRENDTQFEMVEKKFIIFIRMVAMFPRCIVLTITAQLFTVYNVDILFDNRKWCTFVAIVQLYVHKIRQC